MQPNCGIWNNLPQLIINVTNLTRLHSSFAGGDLVIFLRAGFPLKCKS